ncbi:hypothetical protein FRC03_003691 [Tulasnella sp. 419]|nr:hypothetical protein FRC03_003691 [Tulasnella sp. 419]
MHSTTILISLLAVTYVVVADKPAGALLRKLEPRGRSSTLSGRDLGVFTPKHKVSPGIIPSYAPRVGTPAVLLVEIAAEVHAAGQETS